MSLSTPTKSPGEPRNARTSSKRSSIVRNLLDVLQESPVTPTESIRTSSLFSLRSSRSSHLSGSNSRKFLSLPSRSRSSWRDRKLIKSKYGTVLSLAEFLALDRPHEHRLSKSSKSESLVTSYTSHHPSKTDGLSKKLSVNTSSSLADMLSKDDRFCCSTVATGGSSSPDLSLSTDPSSLDKTITSSTTSEVESIPKPGNKNRESPTSPLAFKVCPQISNDRLRTSLDSLACETVSPCKQIPRRKLWKNEVVPAPLEIRRWASALPLSTSCNNNIFDTKPLASIAVMPLYSTITTTKTSPKVVFETLLADQSVKTLTPSPRLSSIVEAIQHNCPTYNRSPDTLKNGKNNSLTSLTRRLLPSNAIISGLSPEKVLRRWSSSILHRSNSESSFVDRKLSPSIPVSPSPSYSISTVNVAAKTNTENLNKEVVVSTATPEIDGQVALALTSVSSSEVPKPPSRTKHLLYNADKSCETGQKITYNAVTGELGYQDYRQSGQINHVLSIHPAFRNSGSSINTSSTSCDSGLSISDVIEQWSLTFPKPPNSTIDEKYIKLFQSQDKPDRSTQLELEDKKPSVQQDVTRTKNDYPETTGESKTAALRRHFGYPEVRRVYSWTIDARHPSHPYERCTKKLVCRKDHEGQCILCEANCCLYNKLLHQTPQSNRFPNAGKKYISPSLSLSTLRDLYTSGKNDKLDCAGVDGYDTFITCHECRRKVCPDCAGICKEILCDRITCRLCNVGFFGTCRRH